MNRFAIAAHLTAVLLILAAAGGCAKKSHIYPADVISDSTNFEAVKSAVGEPDDFTERDGFAEARYTGRILEDDCD